MRRTLLSAVMSVSTFFICQQDAWAGTVTGVTLQTYGQSRTESQASAISVAGASLPSSCSGRLYIEFDDKEQFAVALAASIANKTVAVYFVENSPPRDIDGHLTATCKVVSIWW